MNPSGFPTSEINANGQDQVLAQLLNDALEAWQKGEPVDVDALAAQWPEQADELRRLLPVMQTCAQISKDIDIEAAPTSAAGPPDHGTLGDFLIQRELGRGGMRWEPRSTNC